MGEIARGPGSVRYNHSTGNKEIDLLVDGQRGFGEFHSIPLKKVTRRGAHARSKPREAWRVLFEVDVTKYNSTDSFHCHLFFKRSFGFHHYGMG